MKKYILALILFCSLGISLNANAQRPYSPSGLKVFEWNVAPGAKQEQNIKIPLAGTLEIKSSIVNDPIWQGSFVLEDISGKMICVRILSADQVASCKVEEDGIYHAVIYNPSTNVSSTNGYASMQ